MTSYPSVVIAFSTSLTDILSASKSNLTLLELNNTFKLSLIKIFNPGTSEPDGLDCRHNWHAWIINLDDNKRITANLVQKFNPDFDVIDLK